MKNIVPFKNAQMYREAVDRKIKKTQWIKFETATSDFLTYLLRTILNILPWAVKIGKGFS